MSLEEIKSEMINYRDFLGGHYPCTYKIETAQTKEELREIIEEYRDLMKLELIDAERHLDDFKKRIGLTDY